MSTAAVLSIHGQQEFESHVTRSLFAGAGAGVLHFIAYRTGQALFSIGLPFPAPDTAQAIPLAFLALMGCGLAMVRGDRLDQLMLAALALIVPGVPFLLGMTPAWTLAFAGAGLGALMVRARLSSKGEEQQLGLQRPGAFNFAISAASTGALAVGGVAVARVLAVRLGEVAAPTLLVSITAGVTVALFAALGSLGAHLALRPDPVEARCELLIATTEGELSDLAQRALSLYRQCGKSLAQLPREAAREELGRTLGKMAVNAAELSAKWAGVEEQLKERTGGQLAQEAQDLERSARAAKDPLAKRQLELAAQGLREECARLEELSLRRERVVARLRAENALFERARVSLIGAASGHAQLKGAELSALSRKLSSLSALQHDEGKLADEVAKGELLELVAPEQPRPTVAPIAELGEPTSSPVPEKVRG